MIQNERERKVHVLRVAAGSQARAEDVIAVEEPLEIRIAGRTLGVTMRTPGNDEELAAGLLLAEGIVHALDDIGSIVVCQDETTDVLRNVVNVRLALGVQVDWDRVARALVTTSSCGLCGKASIESLKTRAAPIAVPGAANRAGGAAILASTLSALPATLRGRQVVFERTGGLHAAGLFDFEGRLRLLREDVGRHNAVDKVVGAALIAGEVPLDGRVLLVSGRTSFEIVQKAAVARCPVVAAVSAPSSLAIELADEMGVTLAGFLRGDSFNVYTHPARIAAAGA